MGRGSARSRRVRVVYVGAAADVTRGITMNEILLVEDNPDDVDLTLRAFRKSNIANDVVVVRDGVEALEYLFTTGRYAGRDPNALPQVVLLDRTCRGSAGWRSSNRCGLTRKRNSFLW